MKASFLISELLEVEKSLQVQVFWPHTAFQQNHPSPTSGVNGEKLCVRRRVMNEKYVSQKWDYVYP